MRESARPLTHMEFDLQCCRSCDPTLDGLLDARFCFRRERAKRFEVGRQFPVLVNPRIVPSWPKKNLLTSARQRRFGRKTCFGPTASSSSRGRSPDDPRASITKPTVSHLRKNQSKRPEATATPWFVSGTTEAEDRICDRGPALFDESYDSPRDTQRTQYNEAKGRWLGETTILPTNTSTAKLSCDSRQQGVDRHILAMRERGREYNEALKERYDMRRQRFQKEREERGALSSFEASIAERERVDLAKKIQLKKSQTKELAPTKQELVGSVLDVVGGHFAKRLGEFRQGDSAPPPDIAPRSSRIPTDGGPATQGRNP